MTPIACSGATMMCTFGTTPTALIPTPGTVLAPSMVVATTTDIVAYTNIPSFGMCTSVANPVVASATAAASGVLTPQTCIPVPVSPWAPGAPTVLAGSLPVLNSGSVTTCSWAGVISLLSTGQTTSLA